MGTVKQVFTGDASQLESAYAKILAAQDRLEAKTQKLAELSQRASQSAKDAQGGMSGAMASTAASIRTQALAYVSLGAVIAGVRQEAEELNKLQDESAATMTSIGQAQSKLVFNLADASRQERTDFFKRLDTIREQNQVSDVKILYDAANKGLSATGGNQEATLNMVSAAAKLGRNSPEDLSAITLGGATIQEVTGVSPQEALAFQASVGGPSFIADPGQQARYIPATIKNTIETLSEDKRDTPEKRKQAAQEIGAVAAALGSVAGDTEGMATRTEVIDLGVELDEFFTKGTEYTIPGTNIKQRRKPKEDPGGFLDRIKYLQEHEADRERFLDQTTNEKQFTIARRELLRQEGTTAKKVDEFLPQISFDRTRYDELAESQASATPEIRTATRVSGNTGDDQQRARDELRSINSEASGIGQKALEETRGYSSAVFGLRQFRDVVVAPSARYLMGKDQIEESIDELEQRRHDIRVPRFMGFGVSQISRRPEELSEREKVDDSYISDKLEALRSLQEQQQAILQQQLDEAKKQTAAIDSQERPVADPRAEAGGQRER